MNHLDYITEDDIFELSDQEYESFRTYLRFIGYTIIPRLGCRKIKLGRVLILYHGNLIWTSTNKQDYFNNRISLEEVKRMAALGMYYEQV